tara:strand:+ start:1159 stop:1398 length:240 start_codon:yes stop_codon:yes gene_type:complete
MDINNIKYILNKWFEKYSSGIPEDSQDYFISEYVDSFTVITLVNYCEDEFNIKFNTTDFQHNEFKTIDGLAKCISNKLN